MRVIQKAKVNRASRKLMGFYRSAYDFRPPFTVVLDAGVIAGNDVTPEAALTKLSYVISKAAWSIEKKRLMMQGKKEE